MNVFHNRGEEVETPKVIVTPELLELLPESEKNSEFIATEATTYMKDVWRRLNSNKVTTEWTAGTKTLDLGIAVPTAGYYFVEFTVGGETVATGNYYIAG